MLDHIGLQVQDVEKSLDFYLSTFGAIGMHEVMRFPYGESIVVGLGGPDGQAVFWLGPPTGTETRELHVAFKAPDRAAVDAVHQAAVAAGTEVLHAPREFPEYHPGYYGVFLRDLDGHNVEAVHHGQATATRAYLRLALALARDAVRLARTRIAFRFGRRRGPVADESAAGA